MNCKVRFLDEISAGSCPEYVCIGSALDIRAGADLYVCKTPDKDGEFCNSADLLTKWCGSPNPTNGDACTIPSSDSIVYQRRDKPDIVVQCADDGIWKMVV